jgi:hypothetical protein
MHAGIGTGVHAERKGCHPASSQGKSQNAKLRRIQQTGLTHSKMIPLVTNLNVQRAKLGENLGDFTNADRRGICCWVDAHVG